MKHRRPFQLRTFLAIYNIFQVLSCLYFLVNIFHTGFEWKFLWQCHMPGYENLAHVKLLYFSYILKGIELIETVCFVLRKKFQQMSFLHIYHHVSTFIFTYFGVTRVGSELPSKVNSRQLMYIQYVSSSIRRNASDGIHTQHDCTQHYVFLLLRLDLY